MLDSNKLKDKIEQFSRLENCEKLIVPCVNPEIWKKHDNDLVIIWDFLPTGAHIRGGVGGGV